MLMLWELIFGFFAVFFNALIEQNRSCRSCVLFASRIFVTLFLLAIIAWLVYWFFFR